ncbi:MAG: hypothetical protein IT259_11870 [Saprospiraceae bacterium]|nr:hypothetical protein [Saprospiraceae bacterium]
MVALPGGGQFFAPKVGFLLVRKIQDAKKSCFVTHTARQLAAPGRKAVFVALSFCNFEGKSPSFGGQN